MTNYIISAKPSQGKSYYATYLVVQLLKQGKIVFTNYPVIYNIPLTLLDKIKNIFNHLFRKKSLTGKKLSSLKWNDDFIDKGLNNCTVFLDEAYKIVNCHDKITETQHSFFATTGHNNVDIYIIAQNYSRINVVIREMAMFVIISKFSNILSLSSNKGRRELKPLFFVVDYYLCQSDYELKTLRKTERYDRKLILFNKEIADSYDTQYYKVLEKPIKVISWLEEMEKP